MTNAPVSSRLSSLSSLSTPPSGRLTLVPKAVPHTLLSLLDAPVTLKALRKKLRRGVGEQHLDALLEEVCDEALDAIAEAPTDVALCTAWLMALARRKRADSLAGLTQPAECGAPAAQADEVEAAPAPHSVRDRLRWVERQVREGKLPVEVAEWMRRNSEGESWNDIARSANKTPAALHKQISRHRAQLRKRWSEDSELPSSRHPRARR